MADPADAFAPPVVPQGVVAPQPTPAPSQSVDPFADQLSMITNTDGNPKYDSVEKALSALNTSQQHIANLEAEALANKQLLEKLKADVEKMGTVDDVVSRLAAQQNQYPTDAQGGPPSVAGLDEQAVLGLITNVMTQNEQETALKSNLNKVNLTLNEKYGEKVAEVVASKARELGTTPQDLKELSKKQPEMVLALFNTSGSKSVSPTTNSYNIPAYTQGQPELQRPEKSLLAGATSKEQKDYLKKVRDSVYRKHGIEV
jgi:hypothetical protein